MDFQKELDIMRQNYAQKPLKHIYLPRPAWLNNGDPLSALWLEKKQLMTAWVKKNALKRGIRHV